MMKLQIAALLAGVALAATACGGGSSVAKSAPSSAPAVSAPAVATPAAANPFQPPVLLHKWQVDSQRDKDIICKDPQMAAALASFSGEYTQKELANFYYSVCP